MLRWWRSKIDSKIQSYHEKKDSSAENAAPVSATEQAAVEEAEVMFSPDKQGPAQMPRSGSFRKYGGDWMDEVISEEISKGKLNDLPGLGKPLKLNDDHSMETIFKEVLKNANYLPPWIELQHEIRDDIAKLMNKLQNKHSEYEIRKEIDEVNNKIGKYNRTCPSPYMQKLLITNENIFIQYDKWK